LIQLAKDWDELSRSVSYGSELRRALKAGTLEEAFGTGTAATIAHIERINIQVGLIISCHYKRQISFSYAAYSQELDPESKLWVKLRMTHNWVIKI